jgi:hypothetical protein
MDIQTALQNLDRALAEMGEKRDLIICGGAALILLRVSARATMDIDVLSPQIDKALALASEKVAVQLGLQDSWLNNGPSDLVKYLEKGWEGRCSLLFNGGSLKVFALSRLDLIRTKFWAACDRVEDIPDIISLQPTTEELDDAVAWTIKLDASEMWPRIVAGCRLEVERRQRKKNG